MMCVFVVFVGNVQVGGLHEDLVAFPIPLKVVNHDVGCRLLPTVARNVELCREGSVRVVERKGNFGVVPGTGGLCRKIAQRVAGELDKRGGEVCRELGQTVGSFYLTLGFKTRHRAME